MEVATVSSAAEAATPPGARQAGGPEGRRSRIGPWPLIVLLTVALVVVTLLSLATGAVSISPRTIFAAILREHPLTETQRLILFHIRLPRVLASGLGGSLARSAGRANVVTLLLAGFAISTMFTNTSYFFELLDKTGASNRILISWLHGVIGIPAWSELGISAALLGLSALAALPLMRTLNTLALGDEYAQQLGVRVEAARVCIVLIGSLLTAVAVSLGGMISFAGLIVPHVARLLLGPDHVRLLPVTVLAGAIFLMLADTLARTIFAPSEVPVGILMAFIGAPFFLYLLRKMKRSYTV